MAAAVISVDLLQAASRSESFPKDWTPERTRQAVADYEKFLRLAAENPGKPLAPTRDIDEFWHLHMLHPQAYYEDCQRLFGKILDHDGGFGKDPKELPILAMHFEQTASLWQQAYGEAYTGPDGGATKCWHNCQSRCHHACKSN